MAARKNFSNHKNLDKEIDNINDIEELKKISRTLIKKNRALYHKAKVTHRCIDKQNSLVRDLQNSLDGAIAQNDEGANLLNQFLGRETLRAYDQANDFRSYIYCLVERNTFQGEEQEMARELLDAVESVPLHYTEESRDKIRNFLANMDGFQVPKEDPEDDDDDNIKTDDDVKDNMKQIDVKNEVKKEVKKENVVKEENTVHKKKANKKKKNAKSSTSKKTSECYTGDGQSSKFTKKQGLKKKAEVINESSLVTGSNSTQKKKGIKKSSVINSVSEPMDLKGFDVEATDFIHDTSVVNDPFMVKFKQASSLCQVKEELKDVDADSEQQVESNNFEESKEDDGLEDGQTSLKSVESKDLEGKSLLPKSAAASCEESTTPDKDPSTSEINIQIPNYFDVSDYIDFPDNMSGRGPRTPSLLPPAHAEE